MYTWEYTRYLIDEVPNYQVYFKPTKLLLTSVYNKKMFKNMNRIKKCKINPNNFLQINEFGYFFIFSGFENMAEAPLFFFK